MKTQATLIKEVKEVVTRQEVNAGVTLTLTMEEAKALHAVCHLIGGDPKSTRRKHFDNIRSVLTQLFGYGHAVVDVEDKHSSIYFK